MLLRFPLLALAGLLSLPGAAPAPQTPSPAPIVTPSNRKAHQLIQRAIAAMGGDKYLQANMRSGNGVLYAFGSTGALTDPGTKFWDYYRYPGDERIELTKKRNDIYIYRGGKGWEITYKGVAPLTKAQLDRYQDMNAHSLDVILKDWARNPKTLMLDMGLSMVDQAQVESVSLTTASGDGATVEFSVLTHLPVRVSWRRDDPLTGGHFQDSVVYGKWIHAGTILTPLSRDHYEGGLRVDQRFYNNVSFAPFPTALFTPEPLKN